MKIILFISIILFYNVSFAETIEPKNIISNTNSKKLEEEIPNVPISSIETVEPDCVSSELLLYKKHKNVIELIFKDNGCDYNIINITPKLWMIEVNNGSFKDFASKFDKYSKDIISLDNSDNSRIFLTTSKLGLLETVQDKKNVFYFNMDKKIESPSITAKTIKSMQCDKGNPFFIKVNGDGAFSGNIELVNSSLYYMDLYNVKIGQGFYIIDECENIEGPISLTNPNRVRFTVKTKHNVIIKPVVQGSSFSIAMVSSDLVNTPYIINLEEKADSSSQIIEILFSLPFSYYVEESKDKILITMNRVFKPLGSFNNLSLKGSMLKNIKIYEENKKTIIEINKKSSKKQYTVDINISLNTLIIHAGDNNEK